LDTIHVAEPNILLISSAFHVTGMGVADWVESWLPKMALAIASCSFSAEVNRYKAYLSRLM